MYPAHFSHEKQIVPPAKAYNRLAHRLIMGNGECLSCPGNKIVEPSIHIDFVPYVGDYIKAKFGYHEISNIRKKSYKIEATTPRHNPSCCRRR